MLSSAGQCGSDTKEDGLTWPVTIAGTTAESIERCPLMTMKGMKANYQFPINTVSALISIRRKKT